MAHEIKPPNPYHRERFTIFLAGSIDMGKAENWQKDVVKELADHDVTILNPRRDDWDSSWEQDKNNPQFREQVEWEHNGLDNANLVIVMLTKKSKAPISLMELGRMIGQGKDVMVCCPTGFYRKGNVDIECELAGVPVYEDLEAMLEDVKALLTEKQTPKSAAARGEYDPSHEEDFQRSEQGKDAFFKTKKSQPGMLFNKALEPIAAKLPATAVLIDAVLNVQVDENIPQDEYDEMISKINALVQGNSRQVEAVEKLVLRLSREEFDDALFGARLAKKYGAAGAETDRFIGKVQQATPIV